MFFLGIISQILGRGLIRFLILLYCFSLLYVILYILFSIFNGLYYFIFQEQDQQTNMYSFYVYKIRFILAILARILYEICLFIVGKITGIFLILYGIYFVARLIGLHILLLLLFKIFRDCKEFGLFDFFDGIVFALIGFDSFGNKILKIFFATFDFTQNFMEEVLGIVIPIPGYTWDLNFFRSLSEILSTVDANNVKDKVFELLKERQPIIKINYVEPTNKTDIQSAKIENCTIKNTKEIPTDADTIESLRITFENAMAKQKCETDVLDEDNPLVNLQNSAIDTAKYVARNTAINAALLGTSLYLSTTRNIL